MTLQELTLQKMISAADLSQAELARRCGVSSSTITNITRNHIPKNWHKGLRSALKGHLLEAAAGALTDGQVEKALAYAEQHKQQYKALPRQDGATKNNAHHAYSEEEYMVIQKQTLSFEARTAFGLVRNPFAEPQSEDEVFLSPAIRFVRETLLDAAKNGNFLAIVGESGAGKNIIYKAVIEHLAKFDKNVVVIEPYIIGMTGKTKKDGKSLTARSIAEAIFRALASENEPTPASNELLYREIHTRLQEGFNAHQRYLVIINEAHDLPVQTLKSLKRFWEMQMGMRRLLSIALVGQTELERRLSSTDRAIREVVQRCEVVTLPPLRGSLGEFLRFLFAQAGVDFDAMFAPGAVDAMQEALIKGKDANGNGGHDTSYPLAVCNLATACLNMAARAGEVQVTREIVSEAALV